MIESGVEGVLVDPGDPEAIAAAVADRSSAIRVEPPRWDGSGRRRRREEFDLDVTARLIGDLYEELYAARRGAEALRVLVYADYAYHVEDGRVSAEMSFALFVARLREASLERLVLIGRMSPSARAHAL